MHELVVLTGYADDAIFGLLALVALRHWRRTHAPGSQWVAGTFASLALVAGMGLLLPAEIDGGPLVWVQKLVIVVLLLFPYSLYRFAATFEPASRRSGIAAAALTGLVAFATLALPAFPGDDEARPAWAMAYIALFLLQWTALSSIAAAGLWRGGRGQPTVARRRMRVLSVASVLLNVTLVLAATASSGDRDTPVKVVVNLLAMGSGLLFLGGFVPPQALRRAWRRPEEDVLKAAQLRLMAATTPVEVTDHLLPHVAGALGGRGAALVDHHGRLIGAYGVDPGTVAAAAQDDRAAPVRLRLECGTLLVWTGPQTPFFGQEELDLLDSFSVVTDLAMARCQLIEDQRRREQRLAEAQRVAHLGSWEWDVRADRLVWSDELYRMFGVAPDELDPTYEGYLARIHPDDRAAVDAQVSSALVGEIDPGTEYRIVRASGEVAWVRVRREVVRDEAGSAVLMRGTLHDITDAKRPEAALHQTSARYRLLQVMAVAANEAESVEEVLQVAVDEICAHTGWAAGHVWRASYADRMRLLPLPIWHLGDRAPATLPLAENPSTSLATSVLVTSNAAWAGCATPSMRALGFRGGFAFPVLVAGRVTCVLEFFSTAVIEPDQGLLETIVQVGTQLSRVVERRLHLEELATARDAAMESSKLKSEFLATMSHEIRTPMNGVIGLTSLLLDGPLDGRQRQYAEGVQGAGEALMAIINDILDFSKIEADKLELELTEFGVAQLVDEVAALVGGAAVGKGLRLTVACDPALPARLRGDAGRLRQVLLNLASNAVKFTEEGTVTLRARPVSESDTSVVLRLEVADTGIGVAEADRHRIFEPFRQADASTTRRFGGTGLGLAISSHLVAMMGGEIGFDSEHRRGSTFWCTLPLAHGSGTVLRTRPEPPVAPLASTPPVLPPGARARVLVVEDNAVNQLVAVAMLGKLGYQADVAANGLEALDALARAEYAAVLMDCQMPELDGYATTAAIRRRPGPTGRTPVIAMTASAMEGDRERCLAAGMDDYIAKPIRTDGVHTVLARWVGEQPAPVGASSSG